MSIKFTPIFKSVGLKGADVPSLLIFAGKSFKIHLAVSEYSYVINVQSLVVVANVVDQMFSVCI